MKGRASAAPKTSRALAPGAALRLSPQGLLVSSAGSVFRVTSGTEATDAQILDVLDPHLDPPPDSLDLSAAGHAVLGLLQQRHAVLPDPGRLVWCDWTGHPGLVPPPEGGEASLTEGMMHGVVADATDPRLARWARDSAGSTLPWTVAWLTPHTLAITRNAEGRGCAFCALFFDGELARTALPATQPWSAWLFSPALLSLAAAMLQTAVWLPQETLPDHHAWWLDLSTLGASVEFVPIFPGCPCGKAADASDPGSPAKNLVPRRFAPVHPVAPGREDQPWRALYRGTRRLDRWDRGAFGVAMASGENAALRAQAEAIERFCMMHAPPDLVQQSAVTLPEQRWSDEEIASLLFSAEQYAAPEFRFSPFHGRLPLDWSWAEHLGTGQRSLVPTSLVGHVEKPSVRLVDATSSGYAAHLDRDEAIAHALLELIERDALLLAWLAARPLVRLEGIPLPALCQAYLVPSDVDLPVILMATPSPRGGLRMASAAALSLSQAVGKATTELSVAQAPLDARPAAARLDDPAGRVAPADHVLFYDHPERRRPVLDWLQQASPEDARRASERWPPSGAPAVAQVAGRMKAAGLEAWVVNRSLPRLFEGWHVVRVLAPELAEMSWGALYLRAAGARAQALLAGRDPRTIPPHPFG